MAEKGLVKETKGEFVIVSLIRQEACAKCRACIAGMTEKEMLIEAENKCNAQVDDWVYVDLKDNGFFKAVSIMYGIPLIGLLGGIVLGYFVICPALNIDTRELASFGFGILGTLLAFGWIKLNDKRWETSKKYRPMAIGITEPDEKQR